MNKPSKAYANSSFLNSPDARPIRVQCELIEPSVRFAEQKVENTIVLFAPLNPKLPTKGLGSSVGKTSRRSTQRTDEQTGKCSKREDSHAVKVLRPSGQALPTVDGVVSCRRDPQAHLICSAEGQNDGSCKQRTPSSRRFIDCLGDQFTF